MSIYNSGDFIKAVKRNPENFYIIHYSCQSLYDDNDSLSPRITLIAISHYATEQTVNFSTHSIAEELHIPREDVKIASMKLNENYYSISTPLSETDGINSGFIGICEI